MKQAFTIVALVFLFFSFSALRGQTATLDTNPSTWVSFGSVIVGEHLDYDITLLAIGTAGTSLFVNYIMITGDVNGQFQVISAPSTPFMMMAGTTQAITVRYSPKIYGYYSSTLTIAPVSGSPKVLTLEGVGTSHAFKANPSYRDFGTYSGSQSFWVSVDPNNGMGSSMTLSSASINGNSAFNLDGIWNQAGYPVTLPADVDMFSDSLRVQVSYNPINNEYVTATLDLVEQWGDTLRVPLSGWDGLVAAPTSVNFGPVPVGVTTEQSVLLTAQGEPGVYYNIIDVFIPAGSPFFLYSPWAVPDSLTVGDSYLLRVGFTPGDAVTYSLPMQISYAKFGDPGSYVMMEVTLSGNGMVGAAHSLSVSPLTHDFGSTVTPGSSGTVNIIVTRDPDYVGGSAVLTSGILSGDPAFTLWPDVIDALGTPVSLPYPMDGTNMAVFTVEFEPWDSSFQSAVFSVYDAMGDSLRVNLTAFAGTVSPDPMIAVSPSTIERAVPLSSSVQGSFKVFNQGGSNLNFSIFSSGAPDYFNLTPMMGDVSPGDSLEVLYTINSAGMAAGSYGSNIEIESNDPVTPTKLVPTLVNVLNEVALMVSPSTYDFGICQVGETYQYGFLIEARPGGASVQIQHISILGSFDWGYYVENHSSIPFSLSSGETDYIWVSFTPSFPITHSAQLLITTSGGAQYTVSLSGTGRMCDLATDPTSYSFFDHIVPGETGQVVINVKRSPLSPNPIVTVASTDIQPVNPQFYFLPDVFNAAGVPVSLPYTLGGAMPDSLFFTLVFEPSSTAFQSVSARFFDDYGFAAATTVDAFGGGITWDPVITVIPDSLQISMQQNTIQSGNFLIRNSGGGTLNYQIAPTGLPPNVTLSSSMGSVGSGASESISFTVNSTGLAIGTHQRFLAIHSNDPLNPIKYFKLYINVLGQLVDFIGVPLSGHAPLRVQFTDQSVVQAAGWRWDFENDGIIDSYIQNPFFTYTMPGSYNVRLVVITPTGAWIERVKSGYVNITNNAPVILPGAIADMEFMEDEEGGPFDLLEVFSDPDGDPMTYTVVRSANIWGSATGDGILTLHATPDWHGTEDITVTAQDPFKGTTSFVFSVTVLPVNDPPTLNVPAHLYFIRNSTFLVDFSQYISDVDNAMGQLSISLTRIGGWLPLIIWEYSPVNLPNIPGQFGVVFSSQMQYEVTNGFRITVNDNAGRAIATADFLVHLLEHFDAQLSTDQLYQYTGQTVQFRDVTLGNPNYWRWDFNGDGTIDSYEQHPTHVYNNAGVYNVRLTLGHSGAQEEDFIFMPGYITMYGTSVTDDFIPPNWTLQGSPYNLFGEIVIGGEEEVVIEPNVEVNLFGAAPLLINGVMNANQARFKPQTNSGRWGGLRFFGTNQREPSELIDCEIVDAILPLDIENSSPMISGVTITVSDTTQISDTRGVRITGTSSPNLNNVELINYGQGILIQNDGSENRDTPTLTNIRVRNSSQTSREDIDPGTGLKISGDAVVTNLLVDNFGTAIVVDGTESNTTPTLTNIRVRNSSQTSRGERLGILITGGAVPSLEDVDISDLSYGIKIEGSGDTQRDTPTLTNIRVRNSSQTSREQTWGLNVWDVASLTLDDAEFDGFYTGILIRALSRVESTPTLTNIRVRNSSQTSRDESVGIDIAGSVTAHLNDVVVEDYPFGVKYFGTLNSRDTATPTLTNIRVRNSSQTSRNLNIGMQLKDLRRVVCQDDSIGGYQIGLEITNSSTLRDTSTPTLTNIRVRNSSQTSRYENAGIFLGNGVGGTLTGADVEGARIGIFIADGNTTRVEPAKVFNCEVGIKAAGSFLPRPLKRHLIVLEPAFVAEHPLWQFRALEVSQPGPWLIESNTLSGYPVYLQATNAGIAFNNNIAWNTAPSQMPFILTNSLLVATYSDIFAATSVPGPGNIAQNPLFMNPAERDYTLSYNSPCIDTGSPILPPDADGTRADMGAFPYLHRASMNVSQRFVTPGTWVTFTNTSLGHDHQASICQWDLGKDGMIESTSRDWTYQFNSPGVYDLRLRMASGTLVDIRDYNAVVVVQSAVLQAPQQFTIGLQGSDITLDWDPVTQTQQGQPITVEYYLVYSSDDPDGYFDFVGNTDNYLTSFTHVGGTDAQRRFYFVIGFTGSLRELQTFIEQNRRMRPSALPSFDLRSRP